MRTASRIACTLALVALIAALPAAAGAAARKIVVKPNDLTPFAANQVAQRLGVFNSGPAVSFWASLKMPVGARITGLSYRRVAADSNMTNVVIQRVQVGKTPARQGIYEAPGSEISPMASVGTIVNGTFIGPTKVVQAGWDYFVMTWTAYPAIGDITVRYETP